MLWQLFSHPWRNNVFLLSENISARTEGMLESLWGKGALWLAAARLYKAPQWQIQSDHSELPRTDTYPSDPLGQIFGAVQFLFWHFLLENEGNYRNIVAYTMKERRNTQPLVVRCKLVLVGDVQCGKTAMLQVLAKDCYPEVSFNLASVCEKMSHKSHNLCFVCEIEFSEVIQCGCKKSLRLLQSHSLLAHFPPIFCSWFI